MSIRPFGCAHLAVMASVPAAAWTLAAWVRKRPGVARRVRLGIAAAVATNELVYYGWAAAHGWLAPPRGLPLNLCDVALWLTVFALAADQPWAKEAVYFLGIAGSGMALLTPDLGASARFYPTLVFFVAHGSVVTSSLFLVWSGALRPRPGAWWRVLIGVNAYAALILLFDLRYGTNYMYLLEKPASASLLDLLGPWPWYIAAAEPVALVILWLLDLPFRRARARPRP